MNKTGYTITDSSEKTLKEIQEATGATPPSVYHAIKLRPKMCFNGCTEKTYKAARRKWG